ncbi:MAG TPA: xanthine dehydrogenase family protein molybdopterin-binding subunit [Bryobacteraceae bacterium]|jgi:CO/xanthine dehydrogenase Mo-binding subunit|nr:xanthine dehydrogenase family protein molybdopterin-binding subunit [Bryobacteraceae bacterium]
MAKAPDNPLPSHPRYKLIGKDYTTPDLIAKVTGRAKYAEDYRADGMLFAKLLLSPVPHGHVRNIDASEALKMPGVKAILTVDDMPKPADAMTDLGQRIPANPLGERGLTNDPVYQGEPILAVCAVDEYTAAEAIEKIKLDIERLPHVVDPLVSLRPGGANARVEGNVWLRPTAPPGQPAPPPKVTEVKWTDADFAEYKDGKLPMGKATDPEWSYGDVDGGFKNAALVLDETFVTPNTSHQTLETRTAMAYWQNGKVFVHVSTQSTAQTAPAIARWLGLLEPNGQPDLSKVVVISEYTGGGFGSKITSAISAIIPCILSKKVGAPVMMRISREEEHYIGRARPSLHGRVKVGFTKEGKVTAVDMFVVMDNGPYDPQGDANQSGRMLSLMYQPPAMRWRGITVLTNTPPRVSQSQPGGFQGIALMEPILAKASRKLGVDQVAIHRINAPVGKAPIGPPGPNGKRLYVTSAYVQEALDRGVEQFEWEKRKALPKRSGTKARGIGVATSCFVGGSVGFDGLCVIKPDGRIYIQSGIGNLGTASVSDTHRVTAELLGVPWEKCEITWGSTARNLPWSCPSGGSQTTHAHTRAAYAVALDAKDKLTQIAAKDLGGKPEDYEVANERVFRKGGGAGMSLAQAAKRAIELGGIYDGHELPKGINKMTVTSAQALMGQGLLAVARDTMPRDGQTHSYVAGFAEVEVDLETGKYRILDYLAVADVGTIIHPRALGGQVLGRSMLGIGHAIGQKWVYDQHYGLPLAKRFHHNKPPTILDAPEKMQWAALDIPDPETPIGARGIGEPPVGAGCMAILNALSDALGDEIFRRAPVTADMILASLEAGKPATEGLTAHI